MSRYLLRVYGRRMYETMVLWETITTGADQAAVARDFAAIWLKRRTDIQGRLAAIVEAPGTTTSDCNSVSVKCRPVGEFYAVDSENLSADLAWIRTQLMALRYRDQEVIDRLSSVSERAHAIASTRKSGQYDTWEALRVNASRLANALKVYRDKHAADAPFPFGREKGDFGVVAENAARELAAAAE